MIAFITPRFIMSEACKKEVSLADLLRKPIIPVMIERTTWPPPGPLALIMAQHIYIDLAGMTSKLYTVSHIEMVFSKR